MPDPGGGGLFGGRRFDAVLFDMDGTLISSAASADRSWRAWADEFGIPQFDVIHGVPANLVVPSVLPPDQVEAGIARILEMEIADTSDIEVLPGAAEALEVLPADRVAIVTSCTQALAQARLVPSGLRPPQVIVTADDVERGKPNPDPFLLGAQALGVPAGRCLVVEDAPAGIESGKAAGCAVLAVEGTHDAATLAAADVVVSGLGAVRFVVGPDEGVAGSAAGVDAAGTTAASPVSVGVLRAL